MNLLKRFTKGKRYAIFLDFEGTQFSHEIIAIGAIKCRLDENGFIEFDKELSEYKSYVKPIGPIGKIVKELTHIDEATLKENGKTLEEMFSSFEKFISVPFDECIFFVFGSNDAKMISDSIMYSRPSNYYIGNNIIKNIMDFLMFISQFVKDEKGNNYSLTSYLTLFGGELHGIPHDPLNDAYDLMNLYHLFCTKEEIRIKEYIKVLSKQKTFPAPIKNIINKLINEECVSYLDFINEIKSYLE